jgi:hypothetical protein
MALFHRGLSKFLELFLSRPPSSRWWFRDRRQRAFLNHRVCEAASESEPGADRNPAPYPVAGLSVRATRGPQAEAHGAGGFADRREGAFSTTGRRARPGWLGSST